MFAPAIPFADPTIPGLSVRDIAGRATDALSLADRRRERLLRRDLARLDAEMLQDLGLDRERS